MNLSNAFTLIIPTYNRPLEIARLLRYLARHPAAFPILILDTGTEESRAANRGSVADLDLNVRLRSYPSSMTPWEKFWRGLDEVKTEFCSLCADDDIVMLGALPGLVEFLERHGDFAAAHGWYFTFSNLSRFDVTALIYASPSLDRADPLLRLRDMLGRYEPVTYALYRTEVLRRVLQEVQPLESLCARELLAGALTALHGKIGRLPLLYYGRSLGPSEAYDRWHPFEFLISSPEELFAQYATSRRILADHLQKYGGHLSAADLLAVIDLMHLKYLTGYLAPEILDFLMDELEAGTHPEEILWGIWPRLAPASSPLWNRLRCNKLLRRMRERLAPNFRLHDVAHVLGIAGDQTVRTMTARGSPREYRLYQSFLAPLAQANGSGAANTTDVLVQALNAYD
jgi:glycosyltransferase domain-containing protein